MKYDIKCDCCGRFISYKQLELDGGASSAFVPDSDVSYEENIFRCKSCTETKGMATPYQSGMNHDVCCRTY